MTERIEGRDVASGAPIALHIENGAIAEIVAIEEREALAWLAPGLVDLQVNGYDGVDFNHFPFTTDGVRHVVQQLWLQGVTRFLPTVITASDEEITQALGALRSACEADAVINAAVAGIHLEGPFLSPQDGPRGAHPASHIQPPDFTTFERWQRAAGGRIRLLTLSPEWPQAPQFIARCVASGVTVSIGHTAATPQQIDLAVAAGASLSTHLGNGAHLQLARHPNYIWSQLAHDGLAAGLIADGDHLPAEVLKVFLRAKGSQAFLVSDVTCFAGMAPGTYDSPIGGRVILSENRRLSMAQNPALLAGSARGLLDGVSHLYRHGLATISEAVAMASARPAALMGLAPAALRVGAPADVVSLLTEDSGGLHLQACWKGGEKVACAAGAQAARLVATPGNE